MIQKPCHTVDADESARAFIGASLLDPYLVDRFASRLAGQSFGHERYDHLWAILCDLNVRTMRRLSPQRRNAGAFGSGLAEQSSTRNCY